MINAIKKLYRQVRGLFPSALPQGAAEFDAWVDDIVSTYTLPTASLDDVKFVLATIIMHQNQQTAFKSKYFFVLTLRAAAAKQVAAQFFYDIKKKQQEAAQIQVSSQPAAAPALSVVPSGPEGTQSSNS